MTKRKPPAPPATSASPWLPAAWERGDALALKALQAGTANEFQQRRALTFIVESLCGTFDASFRPGPDGERETAFAEGRRHVGLQIVKFLNMKPGVLDQATRAT